MALNQLFSGGKRIDRYAVILNRSSSIAAGLLTPFDGVEFVWSLDRFFVNVCCLDN